MSETSHDRLEVPVPNYKRVYQACENCRRKKHKCNLGDSTNPKRPCLTCRRANIECVLPEVKRKGRPAKNVHVQIDPIAHHVDPGPSVPGESWASTSRSGDQTDATSRPVWNSFIGSLDLPPNFTQEPSNARAGSETPTGFPRTQSTQNERRLASQALATFPLRNTSDAIRLLDQAETQPAQHVEQDSNQKSGSHYEASSSGTLDTSDGSASHGFFLVREGLIDQANLVKLFNFYLGAVHPTMPLIPYKRIPISSDQVVVFASREPFLMAAILVVSAALTGDHALHRALWKRAQVDFSGVAILGANASIDVVEGFLLLSEYPPNMGHRPGLGVEDRMCWMTVGTAIRLGYLLGLEQLGMQVEDVDDNLVENRDRGRVAWTYCHFLDRQISIRAGKTFWHRSPGLTFQHLHANPADDYPEIAEIPGIQEDYASYLQCLHHLTQMLTNAHDLLYPSKSRSVNLAKTEHYYKHIDDFTETLAAFRHRWEKKPWRTFPINECVWISFHHLRLYIHAFSFQAYIQRARAASSGDGPIDYFPTGLMGCSDARFILEAIDAAADVLRLAIGRLQPSGALSNLPLRFFLFFSHAGVFLLKAAVIVPLPISQKKAILRLVRALTRSMSSASLDPNHPGVRYASALESLLRRVYFDQDLQTPGSTRPSSPRPFSTTNAQDSVPPVNIPIPGDDELSAILGSRETPFVAERHFQDVASEIEALFRLAPDNNDDYLLPPPAESDLFTLLPPSDPFASLFTDEDTHLWDTFN